MIQLDQTIAAPSPAADFAAAEARPDFAPNTALPRHRWYRFKEGFSAGLVASFTEEFLPKAGGRLLDPFLGSGTTAVEGARLGHCVVGVETNPFMAFLGRVKSGNYAGLRDIESVAMRCLANRRIAPAFRLPDDTTLIERRGLDKWLLNRSVARRFEQVRTAIADVKPRALRNLLTLALVSCIEDVANARKDGKCWRYRSQWRKLNFDAQALDDAFATQVLRFVEDIEGMPRLPGSATVLHGDSRQCCDHLDDADTHFDGLLTSPPYLNSFDYTDIYRPEVFLLHAARNSTELRKIRFKTVRSHVQVAWENSDPLPIPLLQQKIRAIGEADLWCGRIPDMINAYFVDLDRVVEQCAQRLKVGATAGFVVADSAYSGVVIPVDLILSEILERRGYETKKITIFRKTRGNGNHQQRSEERLKEVMVVAEYKGACRIQSAKRIA
ncbi:MAG: hypothetical protein KF715_15945 [Candidatus Didemnitutus sp.]|nr:hypothetical protein [Candidatus Didemnitutus sp.]